MRLAARLRQDLAAAPSSWIYETGVPSPKDIVANKIEKGERGKE